MEEDGTTQSSYVGMIWAGIASVGWYVVGVAVALFFAAPYLDEKYTSWKRKKDEKEYSAKYHKNPDLLAEKLRGQEEAIQRMQEKYNFVSKTALEQEQARKEAKKKEIADLMATQGSAQRLGDSNDKLQADYNPLMGDSSRGYRPPKRSCCGKGGCG